MGYVIFYLTLIRAGGILIGRAIDLDTHFRVGGAIGSELQVKDCPKNDGFRPKCKAASLLLHLTPKSSAYLENSWIWTADHDLDSDNEDQINVFAGRGVLVESQGPTWLYGTASEHNVLYQYQLSGAKDIYLGMIQTESPYFQPVPAAPSPFDPGLFTNDPDFSQCPLTAEICSVSWAIRILNSTTVYSMGSGKSALTLQSNSMVNLAFCLNLQGSTAGFSTILKNA